MSNEQPLQTHQPADANHPQSSSSSNRFEIGIGLLGVFFFPLIGSLFLYLGINGIIRVLSRSENPDEFGWLVTVCCLTFAVFFIMSYFMRTAIQMGSIKMGRALALVVIILVLIVGVVPVVFKDSSFVRQFYGTDSIWLKSAVTAHLSFACSAMMFTNIMTAKELLLPNKPSNNAP